MLLRNKALAVIIIALIILIAVVYTASQVILIGSYSSLEDNSTRSAVDTALHEINYDLSSLTIACNDYATWDDTYTFIEDGNPAYIDSNMGDNTLLNLRLNVMLYVNASGGIIYGKSVDLDSEQEIPVPTGLADNVKAGSPLLDTQGGSTVSGVLMLPSGPLLVAACPILMSDGSGTPRGTLIMSRYLDEDEISLLSDIAGTEMTIHPLNGQPLPADFDVLEPLLAGNGTVVRPVDGNTISGYGLVRDVYGNPAFIIRVDTPRPVYQQGQTSVGYFMLALALSGLAMSMVAMFVMRRTAIGRISRLSESVRRIGAENDLTARLPEGGDDEVADFARTMNTTLDSLEHYRQSLGSSEHRFRSLVENINEVVWETDADLKLTYMSPKALDVFGYEPGELLGRSPFDLVRPGEREQIRSIIRDMIAREGSFALVEFSIVRQDDAKVDIEIGGNPVLDRGGKIVGYQGIARDVSERRKADDKIKASLAEKDVLLKEIHHRVKNNLQIISSLLNLQLENINSENPAITFRESQDRIRSMALIHEKLYQARDISHVDFAEYVRSLTSYLYRSYVTGPGIEIVIDIKDVSLGIDTAIPCGLIINELVSNSLKYAFRDTRGGEIRIGLIRCNNEYTLTVSDSGAGLPADFDFRNTPSLGLQLVNTLVHQIEGTIELESSHGTAFRITFAELKSRSAQPDET